MSIRSENYFDLLTDVDRQYVIDRNQRVSGRKFLQGYLTLTRDLKEITKEIFQDTICHETLLLNIRVKNENGEEQHYSIHGRETVIIGRSQCADIQLNSQSVSLIHCRIGIENHGQVYITDLGSSNGTFHGDKRLKPLKRYRMTDEGVSIGTVTLWVDTQIDGVLGQDESDLFCWLTVNPQISVPVDERVVLSLTEMKWGEDLEIVVSKLEMLRIAMMSYNIELSDNLVKSLHPSITDLILKAFIERLLSVINSRFDTQFCLRAMACNSVEVSDLELLFSYIIQADRQLHCISFWCHSKSRIGLLEALTEDSQKVEGNQRLSINSEVVFRLIVSKCLLSRSELDFLSEGDTLLLQKSVKRILDFDLPEQIICSPVSIDANNFQFKSEIILQEKTMQVVWSHLTHRKGDNTNMNNVSQNNDFPVSNQYCETTCLDPTQLPVIEATIEIGRFTLSLEELAQLAPGQIVSTGVSLTRDVQLRIGDEVVAGGKLIRIEDELGFEVNWRK